MRKCVGRHVGGRFLSIDPVGFKEHMDLGNSVFGFNRYAYANNNPMRYTDPDGKMPAFLTDSAKEQAKEAAENAIKDEIADAMRENGKSEDQICRALECVRESQQGRLGYLEVTECGITCNDKYAEGDERYPAGSDPSEEGDGGDDSGQGSEGTTGANENERSRNREQETSTEVDDQ